MPDHTDAHLLCEPEKSNRRNRILVTRRSVGVAARAAADEALRGAVTSMIRAMRPDPLIAGYVPLSDEPGGPDLPAALLAASGRGQLILPLLQPDQDLDWAYYRGPDSLRPAPRGLREPTEPRLGPTAIGEADLIVVPALATDRTGLRLGRGGGSYDRALARVPRTTPVVALLYPDEQVENLPGAPHDRPVTAALLVDNWITTPPTVSTVWYDRRPVSLDSATSDPPP